MFLIRYDSTGTGVYVVKQITPAPLEVQYPEEDRVINVRVTQDKATVIQRPSLDSRPRRWVWDNFRIDTPLYETQWTLLKSLEVKARLAAGRPETIQIWENTSGQGEFGNLTSGTVPDTATALSTGGVSNLDWTTVRIVQIGRKVRAGSYPTTFEGSFIEFIIDDATYGGF